MTPPSLSPFKAFLLFVGAASLSVGASFALHRYGHPMSVKVEEEPPRAVAVALPAPVIDASKPVPSIAQATDRPVEPHSAATILKAVPVKLAVAEVKPMEVPEIKQVVPVPEVPHEAKSIAVAMQTTTRELPGWEPFKTSLAETLRMELPRALPLPTAYQAVLIHDNDWLAQVLAAGFPVDDETPFGDTALCAAVKAGNAGAVDLLLLHGADPNKKGRDGQYPLALASLVRSPSILPALLKAGADANGTFSRPLPAALLERVLYPELKSSLRSDTGVTPLMATSARGDVEATLALLQHGAKPEKPTTTYYRYPINFAAEQEFIFIMRVLLGRSPDSEPDTLVTVDLSEQRAYLRQFGKLIDSTTVSTGREGYDTPPGRYLVTDKHKEWTSTLYHVSMPWFMRLNCSAIGLHAGYVTGEPASHGCIRLPYDKVKKWFGIVKVGDEVQIVR